MNRNKLALKRTSKCNYMAPPRIAAVENDNISNQRQVVPGGRRSFLLAIPLMLAAVVPVAAQDSDFVRSAPQNLVVGNLGNPGITPPQALSFGRTYAEWSAAWWQWAYSMATSPGRCPRLEILNERRGNYHVTFESENSWWPEKRNEHDSI